MDDSWAVMLTAQRKAGMDTVHRLTEGLLAASGLVIAGYLSFYGGIGGFPPGLLYLPVPFLLWAAVRFEPAGAPVSLLLISVPALFGTMGGRGPFYLESPAGVCCRFSSFCFSFRFPSCFCPY